MPESRHEVIADGIRQLLASIEEDGGANFWHTPDAVLRVTFFEDAWLDASIGTGYLIFIRPGDEIHTEETTGEVRGDMEIFILIARKNGRASENPFTESSPTRWLELNRCFRDILKKLWSWSTSGYFTDSGLENISAEPILIDRTQEAGGWVFGQLRLRPSYTYVKETP
jgi:hypothetical protein